MKEHSHCTSGVGPGASANGETVSISVDHSHPLLQLKRALPWATLCEVMGRHGRRAGKNTEGRPGLPWAMALYVPLVVWMLVKQLNSRALEASLAEHVVARVCIGRQDDPWPQMRDHAKIARAYAALGKEGVEEIKTLILHVATAFGCADPSRRSSDTTAQELPIGYPNEPGIVRGWAQRCGRALQKRKTRAVLGVDMALAQVETILRAVKEPHLFAKGKPERRLGRCTRWPSGSSHRSCRGSPPGWWPRAKSSMLVCSRHVPSCATRSARRWGLAYRIC